MRTPALAAACVIALAACAGHPALEPAPALAAGCTYAPPPTTLRGSCGAVVGAMVDGTFRPIASGDELEVMPIWTAYPDRWVALLALRFPASCLAESACVELSGSDPGAVVLTPDGAGNLIAGPFAFSAGSYDAGWAQGVSTPITLRYTAAPTPAGGYVHEEPAVTVKLVNRTGYLSSP